MLQEHKLIRHAKWYLQNYTYWLPFYYENANLEIFYNYFIQLLLIVLEMLKIVYMCWQSFLIFIFIKIIWILLSVWIEIVLNNQKNYIKRNLVFFVSIKTDIIINNNDKLYEYCRNSIISHCTGDIFISNTHISKVKVTDVILKK